MNIFWAKILGVKLFLSKIFLGENFWAKIFGVKTFLGEIFLGENLWGCYGDQKKKKNRKQKFVIL